MTPEPRIVYDSPTLRVIETPKGPVVELPDGRDSLGAQRWIRAVLSPDRLGIGEPVIEGWKAIARAACVTTETARQWATRPRNPLPVFRRASGVIWTPLAVLKAWLEVNREPVFADQRASKDRRRRANREAKPRSEDQ